MKKWAYFPAAAAVLFSTMPADAQVAGRAVPAQLAGCDAGKAQLRAAAARLSPAERNAIVERLTSQPLTAIGSQSQLEAAVGNRDLLNAAYRANGLPEGGGLPAGKINWTLIGKIIVAVLEVLLKA